MQAVSTIDNSLPKELTLIGRPSPEELVERARSMIPTLRARSQKTEKARRLLDETLKDFIDAGFHLIGQPVRFGGMGYGQDVIARVSIELNRGCGSSGWLGCFFAAHNMMIGMFSEEAQREAWGDNGVTLCSTVSTAGILTYEARPDGVQISGKVRFSSGIDCANWLIIISAKGLFLIPKKDVQVDDDWFVMGMRGTGSKAVVLENVFVPSHRNVKVEDLVGCSNYGAKHYEAIHYRLPFEVWSTTNQCSAVVGTAQGLIDQFDERIRQRKDPHTGQPATQRPGWQLRFAEASAGVEAARALFDNIFRDFEAWHAAGGPVVLEERIRVRRNIVYVSKLCVQAVDQLIDGGDSHVVYDSSPIQRAFRDCRTAAISTSQTWDEPAVQYSRVHWGLPLEGRY